MPQNTQSNVTQLRSESNAKPPALAWKDLRVAPPGASRPVLRDVSGEIGHGQWVTFVGPNGAGKTTFFRALVGLAPFQGEIWVHGEPWQTARWRVQMAFQPPAASFVGQTVLEELAISIAARAAHVGEAAPDGPSLDAEVRRWMHLVGLSTALQRPVDQLSGGEMAKLAVAGALASGADVLLLDETQAELDPDARAAMREVLRGLARAGRTVLLVTHDMDDVLASDAVVVVKDGHMSAPMSPRAFFYADGGLPPCDHLGFAPPYLVQVARRVQRALAIEFSPLSEQEFVEGWQRVAASQILDARAQRGNSSIESFI
ncbi:ABC transporter ATP-binding protein [Alicyclobacillus sendaiensis]|uniref:ABC transporter ATP-binding protein n=1 Tax=Alicyclobacillus sendaiensis PA2 TaxID=3029425 RepID=A0ABT6XZV4_ALISE|nr:ABC transporter ATP-binding protein [Alicyclobacillus sendaiensis]MDI9260607.1 ABC transporter ATP-binding protein [Alicyclobacillus sendaiensis PA2]